MRKNSSLVCFACQGEYPHIFCQGSCILDGDIIQAMKLRAGIVFGVLLVITIGFNQCAGPDEKDKGGAEQQNVDAIEKRDLSYYRDLGRKYASETQAVLGKNLMNAIQEDGPEYALEFCNVQAYPLTDSMATKLGAQISRVSDRPRNPENAATAGQLDYIREGKQLLAAGKKIEPLVQRKGDRVVALYPIVTNPMCLNCHGKPKEDINEATLAKIDELYPNDKARGYESNQLRGAWVVEMEEL